MPHERRDDLPLVIAPERKLELLELLAEHVGAPLRDALLDKLLLGHGTSPKVVGLSLGKRMPAASVERQNPLNVLIMLIAAGVSSTMNNTGNRQKTSGKMIFTATFIACSSAR